MIPITRPFLMDEEAMAAKEAVLSGWVSQGPKVKEFENMFAECVGAPFACAVSNCTVALHTALLAVGVKPGDVVITVSHSFIATANSIRYCGAEPVFVDIDGGTYNMDVLELERFLNEECEQKDGNLFYKSTDSIAIENSPLSVFRKFSPEYSHNIGRVAAILAVHQIGRPCDINRIVSIASRYGIKVVEDAACAIGSKIEVKKGVWEKIGKPHGDVACFSFHPRKVITTGEGGMLTTGNAEYDHAFRLLRQHGMTVPDTVRHNSNDVVFEEYALTGYNYRMTDIQAAIGIEQIKKLESIVEERIQLADSYKTSLKNIPFILIPEIHDDVISNWQSYPVRLDVNAPFTQRDFMKKLLDKGIASRRGIMNAHQEAPYKAQRWYLPKSEEARDNVVLIPLFNGITKNEIEYISSTIKEICLC
jgi:perosamine synthetase